MNVLTTRCTACFIMRSLRRTRCRLGWFIPKIQHSKNPSSNNKFRKSRGRNQLPLIFYMNKISNLRFLGVKLPIWIWSRMKFGMGCPSKETWFYASRCSHQFKILFSCYRVGFRAGCWAVYIHTSMTFVSIIAFDLNNYSVRDEIQSDHHLWTLKTFEHTRFKKGNCTGQVQYFSLHVIN